MNHPIIGAVAGGPAWLASPAAAYLLRWEQERFDAAVADVFGYYAVQVGLAELDSLRANRISCRIHARLAATADASSLPGLPAAVHVDRPEELPFASQSLDLVTLPHVLEFAADPHEVLREVERVLRPEGRLVVSGLNPISLWGARNALPGGLLPGVVPRGGRLIAQPRLRDWLKLLGFEPDRAHYGCYRPPCRTQVWLDRTQFIDRAGDRWWPICGAAYVLSAVKRVRAMRLVGPAWKKPVAARAPAPVAVARVAPDRTARLTPDRTARIASDRQAGDPPGRQAAARMPVSGTCSRETAAAD